MYDYPIDMSDGPAQEPEDDSPSYIELARLFVGVLQDLAEEVHEISSECPVLFRTCDMDMCIRNPRCARIHRKLDQINKLLGDQ